MYRPLVTWIRRKRSKVVYIICLVAFIAIILLNNGHNRAQQVAPVTQRRLEVRQPRAPQMTDAPFVLFDTENTRNDERLDQTEIQEYTRRQKTAFKACRESNETHWLSQWSMIDDIPKFRNKPMVSTKTNLFYCPVGKVASSFFTRWVLAMNKPGPMTSPYDIAMRDAGRGRAENLERFKEKENKVAFVQKATRVVFGRNPYSRIFSAYVDKLFSPNPFYWGYWGKKSVQMHANNKSSPVFKCGSNVTFAQFVAAVVKELSKNDVHLIPVTSECNACQMPYNVLGRLENTEEDLDFASRLLNISSSFQHEGAYKAIAQKDVILDAVNSAFSWKGDIKKCGVSFDEMGKRMWRKFQIRGVIDSSIGYPFRSGAIDRLTASEFIQTCERAIRNSTNVVHLKKQRKSAMKSAYSNIPKELITQIQRVYALDFAYFDYEIYADFLTAETNDSNSLKDKDVIFRWEKPWIVK